MVEVMATMRKACRHVEPERLSELQMVARKRSLCPQVRRARAVLRFLSGETYRDICRGLDIAQKTLASWIKRFREHGVEGLNDRRPPGRPGYVHAQVGEWVPDVIRLSPRSFGTVQDRWTLTALQELCHEQTGMRPSTETIRRVLHRLGLSWKRAKQSITSPDLEYEGKKGQ